MAENKEEEKSNVEMAASTMLGDMMQLVVQELKDVEKPWQQISEEHQGEILDRAEARITGFIEKAVSIIAGGNNVSLTAKLESVTFGDVAKIVLKTGVDVPAIHDLTAHGKGNAVKISILDAGEYLSDSSTKPEAEPDQKDLGIGEEN